MITNLNIIQHSAYTRLVESRSRWPHAFLIQGPAGVGKMELAVALAGFLLCESPSAQYRCGRCGACHWVDVGNHPDLRVIEPEALAQSAGSIEGQGEIEEGGKARRRPSLEVRIEQIRELTAFLQLGSHRGGHKVAIVHPAEAMNEPAANAILKSLEEPPGKSLLILVSHRPARLHATVRSRCVQVTAAIPDVSAAVSWLESRGVAPAKEWLALAGGAPGRAVDMALGARAEAIGQWRASLQAANLGALEDLRDRDLVEPLVDVLQRQAFDRAVQAFGQMPKYGLGCGRPGASSQRREWLAYARALNGYRGLSRHPLNPRLFVSDLLSEHPDSER